MAKKNRAMAERRPTPLIGITGPAKRGRMAWLFTRYAVRRSGAEAYRITPRQREPLPTNLAGIIIGGGDDIDPQRYGEVAKISIKPDKERDDLEWRMLDYAEQRKLPILGICRGAQLLNVFYGGNLHQDLTAVFQHLVLRRTVLPRKRIQIEADSRLFDVMGTEETHANSLHHQAVDRLAEGFRVAARDFDNIVQAIEGQTERFLLGVQWHPEYLPQRRAHRRIFAAFTEAARKNL